MDRSQRRILIVEDDADSMKILSSMLTSAGYQVVRAYGGEDALRKIKAQRFDLVLTDLAMPKMSGVEVIEAIKQDGETSDIPVVAVTAFVWDQIAQSAGQVGCDGFIRKPFTAQQLLREVEKHLEAMGSGRAPEDIR